MHYRAAKGGPRMIATVLDFGVGNIHSLTRALLTVGLTTEVTDDPREALSSDLLVLPGVGAFPAAAEQLAPVREQLRAALADGLPCLAICLGMQLLFEGSDEGQGKGIGLIGGCSTRLTGERVPHMGWNTVATASSLIPDSRPMYFAHSYACRPNSSFPRKRESMLSSRESTPVLGWTECDGDRFPALVQVGRTTGVQFHPEKSGTAGREFLRNWIGEVCQCE